ncbi:MAG TPA: GNAT family N-acetyltransferase [Amycolatopsis sp.]
MISIEPWDSPDAVTLRQAQRDELNARYETPDHEAGPVPTAESIAVFLVARDQNGKPVGCGGLRRLGPGEAEIKRMYVVPEARGSGLSTRLLRALEEQARSYGVTRLLLETGIRQPDAMRFYEREGYRAIDAFGAYRGDPLARCYAREITAVTPFGLFPENAVE